MIRRLAKWIGYMMEGQTNQPFYPEELLAHVKQRLSPSNFTREKSSARLKEMTFVVFDTETTGFHPYAGDALLSLGAVMVREGKVVEQETFHEWVHPNRSIPVEIQELLDVTEAQFAHAQPPLVVIDQFLNFADSACLVAHNLDFDLHFINKQLKTLCKQKLPHPTIDTLLLACHLFPTLRPHTLDQLLQEFRIPIRKRHYAQDDAMMTAELFVRLLNVLEERGIHTFHGLEHFIRRQSSYGGF